MVVYYSQIRASTFTEYFYFVSVLASCKLANNKASVKYSITQRTRKAKNRILSAINKTNIMTYERKTQCIPQYKSVWLF